MRKFSIYFACFFTLILMGCGDNSGDPTAQISKLEAAPADVTPGGDAVITATVVKAVGKKSEATAEATVTEPGWGENVTFRLLTANGGRLSILSQKTDGKGEAKTVYTAGNNYSNDTIEAKLDNGMSATIVIKKTGSLTGANISSLVASPATVAEGQTSIVTAKVTDGNSSNPMIGEAVTFTIATNESGGCFINPANACVAGITANSDSSGNAVAIYRAGGNSSTVAVYDTVRATLANGSTSAVFITRSAGTAGSIVTVTANPTSVLSTGVSLVTANVKDSNGAVVNGASVTFTLTGSGTVGASPVTTDGAGNAVTTYTGPGAATGSAVVTATVTIGGVTYTGATVIAYAP